VGFLTAHSHALALKPLGGFRELRRGLNLNHGVLPFPSISLIERDFYRVRKRLSMEIFPDAERTSAISSHFRTR
jgi:hypothetical protein